jgi:DNA-binding transcriptional ArsR family regulator
MSDLPDWCCASGCKKCPAWRDAQEQRPKCRKCKRPALAGMKSCRRCRDAARRHARLSHARRGKPPREPRPPKSAEEPIDYTPADEWLERPRVRVLRALRRFDWITCEELADALDVPAGNHKSDNKGRERNAFNQLVLRLFKSGLIERRVMPGVRPGVVYPFEYRLARTVPIAELEPPLDMEVAA